MKTGVGLYVNLQEAAELLEQSVVFVQLCLKRKALTPYAPTPRFFPHYYVGPDAETFEPFSSLQMCFSESLKPYCMLVHPIEWGDGGGQISCEAIQLATMSGGVPSVSLNFDRMGHMGDDGQLLVKGWRWSFSERDLRLKETEILRYKKKLSKDMSVPDYIKKRQAEKISDNIIAWELNNPSGPFRMTHLQVARAFKLGEGLNESQIETLKKRGERFCKQGKGLAKMKINCRKTSNTSH